MPLGAICPVSSIRDSSRWGASRWRGRTWRYAVRCRDRHQDRDARIDLSSLARLDECLCGGYAPGRPDVQCTASGATHCPRTRFWPRKDIKIDTNARVLTFPLRPDFEVVVHLPRDGITTLELQRLGMFLYPYVNDFGTAGSPRVIFPGMLESQEDPSARQ